MNYAKSAIICRAALKRGELSIVHIGNTVHWSFGRRLFSAAVVAWLIEAGEAEQVGNIVRTLT